MVRSVTSTGPFGQVPLGQAWQLPGGVGAGALGEYAGRLTATPTGYGLMTLSWSLPGFAQDIDRFAVVRAGFGHPASRFTGVTVVEAAVGDPVRSANDGSLQPGRWYYYSLFVRDAVSERWVRAATATQIAVKDWGYHHDLWESLPIFYRTMDQQLHGSVEQGPLYRFLKIFAFEFDLMRSMAQGVQQMRSLSDVSSRMLESYAADLGTPYERTIGDTKMRGILSHILHWRKDKGTAETLQRLVQVVGACADARVETVPNILLDHNDSGWTESTVGRWVSESNAALVRSTAVDPGPRSSAGYLSVTAVGAGDVVFSHTSVADIKRRGVKVRPNEPYAASIYTQSAGVNRTVLVDVEWYDRSGVQVLNEATDTNVVGPFGQVPHGQINPTGPYGPDGTLGGSVIEQVSGPNNDTTWTRVSMVRMAPPTARFARMVVTVEAALAAEVHHFDEAQLENGFTPSAYEPARKVRVFSCGGRVNKVTNPTFELSMDGWTADNTALTDDPSEFRFGTQSLLISPTVPGECSATTVIDGLTGERFYTFSIHALPSATGGVTMAFDWMDEDDNVIGTSSQTNTLQADGRWKRPWVTGVGPEGTVKAALSVTASAALNIDAALAEPGNQVQDYFDGSFDGVDYFWAGVAHESESLFLVDREVYESVVSRYLDEYVPASTPWEILYTT